jgi:hypothetical protein
MCLFCLVDGYTKVFLAQNEDNKFNMTHVFKKKNLFYKKWKIVPRTLGKGDTIDLDAPTSATSAGRPMGTTRKRPQGMQRHFWEGCKS